MSVRILRVECVQNLKISKKEVLRYLRAKETTPELDLLISECIDEVYKIASPRAVCLESSLEILDDNTVGLDFMTVYSQSLAKALKECTRACVFAATLGVELDRLIDKYSRVAQVKASICHAIGSALIESFCDYVNGKLIENKIATRRFSPGYGDLCLECQRELLDALDAQRKIGIFLTSSLLMAPSKSVTAIIGIK